MSRSLFVRNAQPKGTCIDRVLAVDHDSGENGRVTYAIAAGNEAGYFALHPETGELTVARAINYADTFILNVTAADHGSPVPLYSTTWLNVTSQTNDENQLSFTKDVYPVNISEDLSVGGVVFSISSTIVEYSSGRSTASIMESFSVLPMISANAFLCDAIRVIPICATIDAVLINRICGGLRTTTMRWHHVNYRGGVDKLLDYLCRK